MQVGAGDALVGAHRRARLKAIGVIGFGLLSFSTRAKAGPPSHPPIAPVATGFDHACGTAVDSEGNVYVSSAGASEVKVFNSEFTELTSISNANEPEPCGLAVNSSGDLFVSERGTGEVVRDRPAAYPLSARRPTAHGNR